MFKWRVENIYSNIIEQNGYRYQIYNQIGHNINEENEYYLLENGYPITPIPFDGNGSFKGEDIILHNAVNLANIGRCKKCDEVKALRSFNGNYVCWSCAQLDGTKKWMKDRKLECIDERKTELLLFKSNEEAERFLRNIAVPEVFTDYSNEEFIFAKGVFKVPCWHRFEYRYYPALFHIDSLNYDLYRIFYINKNIDVKDNLSNLETRLDLDLLTFRLGLNQCHIECVLNNFSAYEFQSAK